MSSPAKPVSLSLSPELPAIIRPGALTFESLSITERDDALDVVLAAAESQLRAHPPSGRDAVRAMYRKTGLDPTRRRPSSEALLRRVLAGASLPRINTLVDVCNWCSAEFQLPYGLYDLDRIRGDLVVRLGQEGEEYPGIRKDVVHLGGRLVLADSLGPFGNPSSDSARTMTGTGTKRALAFVFGPADLPLAQLEQVLAVTSERVFQFCGGLETARLIV